MEKPNQVTGQRAQEEVRGQGSEVVHFIDRDLPTSCKHPPTPTPQNQSLSFAAVLSTRQGRERISQTSSTEGPPLPRAERGVEQGCMWGRGLPAGVGRWEQGMRRA